MSQNSESATEGQRASDGESLGQHETGQPDLDELLHPNVLDTLADFDFSCGDFSGIEPETSAACTTPSSSGRRRSFSQAWDALTPKTLPDAHVNPGLLAGVWNQAVVTVTSTKSQIDDLEATRIGNFEARSQVLEQEVAPESIGPLREESRGKACRGRRAPGGTKRPLNPDRMERKATREKRRREEVNEKFEQLLRVLEQAETTSGLEPPIPEDGQQVGACVNGRRVEVLSRTIRVLTQLLSERSCASSTPSEVAVEQVETVWASPATASACIVESPTSQDASSHSTRASTVENVSPMSSAQASAAAAASLGVASTSANGSSIPTVHMGVPVHGGTAMVMPPGFALPHGLPTGAPGAPPNPSSQPIFIAVPMYVPGQGVLCAGSETNPLPSPSQVQVVQPSAPPTQPASEELKEISTPASSGSELAKEGWPTPGVSFSPMILQMPQFVSRTLAAEGDEKPTHAMCA